VVTTIRLRDPTFTMPPDLVTSTPAGRPRHVIISGQVSDADGSNLFPREFRVITQYGYIEVYILWWKFSTPVWDGDMVTLCGSLVEIGSRPVVRLTNFSQHWLRIDD
jgi:hypothetical protein